MMIMKYLDNEKLLDVVFSDNIDSFNQNIKLLLNSFLDTNFSIWRVSSNIASVVDSTILKSHPMLDVYELGYDQDTVFSIVSKEVSFFDEKIDITSSLFLRYQDVDTFIITFHSPISNEQKESLVALVPYIAKRAHELIFREVQMDLYIDYQKKIDFIKKSSLLFRALDVQEIVALSLSFFLDIFSGHAIFAKHKNKFYGIAINEEDVAENIFIGDISLNDYINTLNKTEFIEHIVVSNKFNIKNIFFIYDEVIDIKYAIFNINIDIAPDREFSELITDIINIATENASNHQQMISFKLEEKEMSHTVDILNRFVKRIIAYDIDPEIYAVNYPARSAGGDFVEVVRTGNRIIFAVADVCGKGYSAAVFTVVLSVFSTLIPNTNLAEAIEEINKFLITKNFSDRFITGFFGIIDLEKNELEYLSCGHEPAFILESDKNCKELKSQYLPLGLIQENYKTGKVELNKESLLCVYTDGLIEYVPFDELVGKVKTLSDAPAKEIVETLYKDLVKDEALQRDDFTCVLMKF